MDPMPLRRKRRIASYVAILVYEKPQGLYKYTERFVGKSLYEAYRFCNRYTPPGAKPFGAWKLTKRYNEGGGPKLEDIRELQVRKINIDNRAKMIDRLIMMNARSARYLKRRQYKSYYNFLTTLK